MLLSFGRIEGLTPNGSRQHAFWGLSAEIPQSRRRGSPLGGMKIATVALGALVAGLLTLPLLLVGGDTPPPPICGVPTGPIAVVLETIRTLESGGNYQARAAGSTASGAYQFLDSTWNDYGGYGRAADAPAAVQDAKATDHVTGILDANDQDVTTVPVVWYVGHVPTPGSPEWDTVPYPNAGNVLTPRQYQTRWMAIYRRLLDQNSSGSTTTTTAAPTASGCVGGQVPQIVDGWALPGPIAMIDANPAALGNPHSGEAAWDWIIPIGTPIYAVHDGTVSNVRTWDKNWWGVGCGTVGGGECDTCGIGLTIQDTDGVRWTYCHGSALTANVGQHIAAGQQVLWSGNTGRSGAPHVHIEIRVSGEQRCPQPLLRSLYFAQRPLSPTELPASGCNE